MHTKAGRNTSKCASQLRRSVCRFVPLAAVLAFLSTLSACGRADVPTTYVGQPTYWQTGYTERTQLVIRDIVSWRAAWATLHARESAAPVLPEIDFSKEMIVLVALGTRPSGGFQLDLVSAQSDGETLYLGLVETTRGNCLVISSLTFPTTLIRVQRSAGPVSVQIDQRARRCVHLGCPN